MFRVGVYIYHWIWVGNTTNHYYFALELCQNLYAQTSKLLSQTISFGSLEPKYCLSKLNCRQIGDKL